MSNGNAASGSKGPGAAARSEAEPRILEAHGLTLTLPSKLPFRILRHIQGDVGGKEAVAILTDLLGAEQMETVWAADLSMDEGVGLLSQITDVYGTTPGK